VRLRQAIWTAVVAALLATSTSAAAAAPEAAKAPNTVTAGPCTSALMTPPAGFTSPGNQLTFTASSTTCANPQYEFFLQKPGGAWVAQTAFGGNTWVWNTAGLNGGIYWIGVWARDTGSLARYEAYWIGTYTLWVTPCRSAALSTPDVTSWYVVPGSSLHFTASATWCSNPQGRFWLKKPGGVWKMMRDYGAWTWTWNTKGYPNGTYLVGVWLRQVGSPKTYDAYDIQTYYLGDTPNCSTGLSFQATPGAPQAPGTSVQLFAHSVVCGGLYEFWMKRPGLDWKIFVPYSTNPAATWDTTGYPNGTYEIGVWEKLPGWKPKYLSYNITTYRLDVGQCDAAIISSDLASPQAPGAQITFQGSVADCGTPDLEFWLEPSPGAPWVILRAYAPQAPFTLDSTGAPAGQIRIGVWARQPGSNTRYDTYAITSYWLGT
jgi:hypothetical protein